MLQILTLLLITLSLNIHTCEKKHSHGNLWADHYITYSFVTAKYTERGGEKPLKVSPLGTHLKGIDKNQAIKLIRKAAASWSHYSKIELIEICTPEHAKIRIGEANIQGNRAGVGYYPGNKPINGDIHIDVSDRIWTAEVFYHVILHEMGHALGMTHNSSKNSIMYKKITDNHSISELDIAHLQSLYGTSKKAGKHKVSYKSQITQNNKDISIKIISKNTIKDSAPKILSKKKVDVNRNFFTAHGNWSAKLKANAKDNKNQCLKITSRPFHVKKDSRWSIKRSYTFHGTEKINYLISLDGGITFTPISTESGTSDPSHYSIYAKPASNNLVLDLSAYSEQEAIVAIEYINTGLYWNTQNKGVHIKNINLFNIIPRINISEDPQLVTLK